MASRKPKAASAARTTTTTQPQAAQAVERPEPEQEDEDEPVAASSPQRTAADVFDAAADAFAGKLYLVTDPRLVKRNASGSEMSKEGQPLYMNQAEMYNAYMLHLSMFRNTIADDLTEPARSTCMRFVRKIQQAADAARFSNSDKPRAETVLTKQKENLRRLIATSKQQCRDALAKGDQLQQVSI